MGKARTIFACRDCRQQVSQWVGRCPGCGAWGTIDDGPSVSDVSRRAPLPVVTLTLPHDGDEPRVPTGIPDVDRVLGGGLVPASVTLLAGEPGIGKSTLLLQLVAGLGARGIDCLLVSGEESHGQVGARARRLGVAGDVVRFAPGRDLAHVLQTARAQRPFVLAIDSIQTLRDTAGQQMPGGVSQVRTCTDALVGLAKEVGIAVILTGHVTKDGDLAGPRALEHAVDTVLTFDGDPRSGLRVLSCGKNRFGTEGESAWFEMEASGLTSIDPSGLLTSGERVPGAATALARSGRRALAIEVQALVGSADGPGRRQVTGLDARRFQLVAAVLDRTAGVSLGRAELFGATSGGGKVDDPACDLAIAAALVSAATGVAPPATTAFVGEISLTGLVRPVPAMAQRLAAAEAAGISSVVAPVGSVSSGRVTVHSVRTVGDALGWATDPSAVRVAVG